MPLLADLRVAALTLRRDAGFAATAIAALAPDAEPDDVRFLIVMQGMRLAGAGVLIGVPSEMALARVMVSMIFGIATWDPLVFAVVSILLCGIGWCAAYVPAMRATRVDPITALRG